MCGDFQKLSARIDLLQLRHVDLGQPGFCARDVHKHGGSFDAVTTTTTTTRTTHRSGRADENLFSLGNTEEKRMPLFVVRCPWLLTPCEFLSTPQKKDPWWFLAEQADRGNQRRPPRGGGPIV
jgi:hypothetical protein